MKSSRGAWRRTVVCMKRTRKFSSDLEPHRVARVAVVGSGRMGAIRASAIVSNPRLELGAIVDSDRARGQKLASYYRVRCRKLHFAPS